MMAAHSGGGGVSGANNRKLPSNVSGRKEKCSINRIFVINGIIHETLSSKKKKPVTLNILDYTQMFESMVLKKLFSDLFES